MQVLLNTDPHIGGRHRMTGHLETVVKDALGHFGERVTRVQAHLADTATMPKPLPTRSTAPSKPGWRGSNQWS
jgi:hypothetical protein